MALVVSDQDFRKKAEETNYLLPFLEARQFVTGGMLSFVVGLSTENPDFICVRPNGTPVGVELTKVAEDRDIAFWDRLRYGEVTNSPLSNAMVVI